MIGGGLALNDTRFILVRAMCPMSSWGRSVTLFLSLDASKSVVGVQTGRRKKEGYKRFGWLRPEGSRSELGGPAVGSVDVYLVSLSLKKSISPR